MNSSQRFQRLELVLLIVQERILEIDPKLISILQGPSESPSDPSTLEVRETVSPTLLRDSLLFQDVKPQKQGM